MTSGKSWSEIPAPHKLLPDTIDVWLIGQDQQVGSVSALRTLLHDDELRRADRFYFERDRHRFVVARAWLRKILGAYLEIPPDTVQFQYGARGKPELVRAANTPFYFNMSHSNGYALYALSDSRAVGVDIEAVRPLSDLERLARHSFSASEVAALFSLPQNQWSDAFFNGWTRKEAFIKAVGEGLYRSLKHFDVSLTPDSPAALLRTHDDPTEVHRWSMKNLELPIPNFKAALCVARRSDEVGETALRCYQPQEREESQ